MLYFVAAWGTLTLLAAGAFPGGAFVVLAIAAYTTIPLLIIIRYRGWPFYPGAAFRLLVVRPFWYTQLLLPLVSSAGLIGLLAGARSDRHSSSAASPRPSCSPVACSASR